MQKLRVSPLTTRDLMEKMDGIEDKIDKNKMVSERLDIIETKLMNISFISWIFLSVVLTIASIFSSFLEQQLFALIFILIGSSILIGVVIFFFNFKKVK